MAVTIEQMDAEALPAPEREARRQRGHADPHPQSESSRRMQARLMQRAAERQWRRAAD